MAVCGCYAQLSPEENEEIGADVLFGTGDRMAFVEAVERAAEQGTGEKHIDRPFSRRKMELLPAGAVSGRTRAMLKVQDGCRNFCSYCIIPYVRGSLRSMPVAEAVSEVRRIRDEGFRELVLTGIEVASYGLDLEAARWSRRSSRRISAGASQRRESSAATFICLCSPAVTGR